MVLKLNMSLILFVLFVACEYGSIQTPSVCDTGKIEEEMGWLEDKIDEFENDNLPAQIIRFRLNGDFVYWVDPCYQCPDGLISVFDCEGNILCEFGGIDGRNTCPDFDKNRTDSTLLYDNTKTSIGCAYENPLEDIDWLHEKTQQLEMRMSMAGWQIIRYQYKGDYVFLIDECYNCADNLLILYDCEGNSICEFGGIDGRNTCSDFATEATDSTMLRDGVQH